MLYTSRDPRQGEIDGRDYYFRPCKMIARLPRDQYYVGKVREEMLQAVDLYGLEADLKKNDLVLIEIFDKLWSGVEAAIVSRMGPELSTASVFMTAVDPDLLKSKPSDSERAAVIVKEVQRILVWRNKDPDSDKIHSRATSAAEEVLAATAPGAPYNRVFHSSPEGPDGEDEWTTPGGPVGRAAEVLKEFISFVKSELVAKRAFLPRTVPTVRQGA